MKQAILFLSILTLVACAGSGDGPLYNENVKGNLVVYRPDTGLSGGGFGVNINSQKVCDLSNGSYFVKTINGPTLISATIFGMPGTSRITVQPPAYVKMEYKESRGAAAAFGGLLGGLIAESTSNDHGPYLFTNVPPEQAKLELKDLHQDCYK